MTALVLLLILAVVIAWKTLHLMVKVLWWTAVLVVLAFALPLRLLRP